MAKRKKTNKITLNMSKKQLRSEQSISIQGGRRAKITYHTHATVVRHELKYIPNRRTRDQTKYLSMTKVRKTSLQGTEGSEEGKDERVKPRFRIEPARLEGELWAPNSNSSIANMANLLHYEKIKVEFQV